MTLMTKSTTPDDERRAITTVLPADERHQYDAQAPSASNPITAAMSLARPPYLMLEGRFLFSHGLARIA